LKTYNPEEHQIVKLITGSRLYGTNTPKSDWDYRGVSKTPLNVVIDPYNRFEQKDNGFVEEDRVIYDLGKFFKLCGDANPNIIEMLFVPENMVLLNTNDWKIIVENRSLFLSKKIKYTFSGYAMSQLNAIRTHRTYFINPPKRKPTREDFGLTDSPKISGDALNNLFNVSLEFFKDEYVDEIQREREYREAKKRWDNYIAWYCERNPARKELEEKFKYDVKHASHLFRLMGEGKELLLTGKITFPLPNAEEILAIKNGIYSYDEVIEKAEQMDKDFDVWYAKSNLPHSCDRVGITNLYYKLMGL